MEFAAAFNRGKARDPLLFPDPEYIRYYWRPYLEAPAYGLWDILLATQQQIRQGKLPGWPSVEAIALLVGQGDRYTILGRKATATRPAQPGTIHRLGEERIAVYTVIDEGTTAQRYVFEVQESLPMLTPAQVATLPSVIRRLHRKQLKAAKLLERWERLAEATQVRPLGVLG